MRFNIGYQLPDDNDSISDIVEDFPGSISGVYFAAPGHASARMSIDMSEEGLMLEELRYIADKGIKMTLLYNANCYGDGACSQELKESVTKTTAKYIDAVGVSTVTTTSPFIAKSLKKEFKGLRLCASVNMWIGTAQAMRFLESYFDEYYLQREFNRDFGKIEYLSKWCGQHGKTLRMLANSGCLYTCPFHTYHDNLVAHEKNSPLLGSNSQRFPSPCWSILEQMNQLDAAAAFLSSSWIRPEDIHNYDKYFTEVKLATRMHSNPRRVISAYCHGHFHGNMFDLMEPCFSCLFRDDILDAELFPTDWFEMTSNCQRNCERCNYCKTAASHMLISKKMLETRYMSV